MMRLVFFCCIVASFHALSAQKPAEIRRNAEKAFSEQQWRAAQQGFAQYQQIKPGDADVLTKLGIAHYQLKEGDLARKYLEYVATQTPNPDACYYYARTLHGLGDWEKAITAYKNYLRKAGDRHPFRANAADNIRRCMSGQKALANTNVALVENLGDRINSEGDEFAPLPSLNHADRLYFSAARAGSIGDRRNLQGLEDLKNGQYCSDMLRATRKTSGWEKTGTLGTLLNTSRHEVALGFNASGDILYFFRGFSTYSGQVFADTADRKDEYAISPPPFSSPMKPEEGDVSVYFFNDSVLLFASRRAGGFGGLDLWIAQKADSTWGDPLNLGASINSPYDETTPFLSADGRSLWFSSNRISSMGGLDVFKAVFDDKKRAWNAPQNAGTPINSSGDEAFFKLSPDGQSAFFSSDRLRDNLGQRDIFVAYFTENLAEQSSKSSPNLFTDVLRQKAVDQAQEKRIVRLPSLLYEKDQDLVSGENVAVLEDMAAAARQLTGTRLLITVHSQETALAKFDLYNGIKRAEVIGKFLTARGVEPERIFLRSVGSGFPLARQIVDGAANPFADRLNQRADLRFATLQEGAALDVVTVLPPMAEAMLAPGTANLDKADGGLVFRVTIALTRQMLQNDALGMFDNLLIEHVPGSGQYRYSAGMTETYEAAAQIKADLIKQGFVEAEIVAYLRGIPINKAEAISLLRKYPALNGWIKGK